MTMAFFLFASVVILSAPSSASASEPAMQTKRNQQNVGLTRRSYRAGKKGVRAGYRGARKGVRAGYRGARKGVRAAYRGGRWVTVKTARGTKRVFRRTKKVVY